VNLTTGELAQAVGGRVLRRGPVVRGVSTDTRTLAAGEAFFALLPREGEGADGHTYVVEAARRGAPAAVVCRAVPDVPEGLGLVEVDDPLLALGRLAAQWRARMPARIVTVTGSVGKTSTRAMLAAILSPLARTLASERSFNNEIGVPLTLFRLDRSHEFCVLEFAMRGPGEIEYLTRIARPEVAIVTNIGPSHIGRLGSLAAIASAKGEVLPLLPRTGAAILNRDDPFYEQLRSRASCPVVSFGLHAEAAVRAEELEPDGLRGTAFTCCAGGARVRVRLAVPGAHFVANALAAAAAARALGVGLPDIAGGLSTYRGTEMRGLIVESPRGFTVLSDCYNASPASVAAALQLLGAVEGRRVFVFGDMAELGDLGPEAHREAGERAAEAGVQLMVTLGDLAKLAGQTAAQNGVVTQAVDSNEEAVEFLRGRLVPGDVVLVKGSRVMHLETVVEGLKADAR